MFNFWERLKILFNIEKDIEKKQDELKHVEEYILSTKQALENLKKELEITKIQIDQINEKKSSIVAERDSELEKTQLEIDKLIDSYKNKTEEFRLKCEATKLQFEDAQKEYKSQQLKIELGKNKLKICKALYKKIQTIVNDYSLISTTPSNILQLTSEEETDLEQLTPSLELPLHSMDIKELRTLNRENNKIIEDVLKRYEKRYTTKSNRAIYQLMVIALRAELQNILTGLKFTTFDKCMESFKNMIGKYIQIASDGNQSIAPTLNNFISEIELLFEKAIQIEYEYYIKKEKERAEQQALRDQMRQEAEERKALEQQKKQVEAEEKKYINRIDEIQQQIKSCTDDTLLLDLQSKIAELQQQLSLVEEKKEEITKLQNGKAGYVYVISNLGSFGDSIFKIGMTRRLDPMDRIKELGSASVPFTFDVHSFIFSENAVDLENELHNRLNDKRTNKVNLRKEFFNVNIDDLETLVQEIDKTAEFNKTMLATEYRQSLSM